VERPASLAESGNSDRDEVECLIFLVLDWWVCARYGDGILAGCRLSSLLKLTSREFCRVWKARWDSIRSRL